MAFSGGVFSRLYSWVTDASNGVKIRSDKMDAEMDGFATGLSTAILKDGTQTVTANIPFAGYKLTGIGAATANGDALRFEQIGSLKDEIAKTDDYTMTTAESGKVVTFSKSTAVTANLPAVASNAGEVYRLRNIGTGNLVIDGNSSEQIEGATTISLKTGDFASVWANAGKTAWRAAVVEATADRYVAVDDAQSFTPTEQAQARANIGAAASGHIFGLTLSNNATDATNDIDIASGEAASEASSPVLMTLASGITKRLDAAWAVGTGNGGLDTGSIGNGTYHLWLIQRSDTGVVDVLFSASATSPTMPTNYDQKRRIGAILRESGSIVAFRQMGDRFTRDVQKTDLNVTAPGSATNTLALSVPTGIILRACFVASLFESNPTTSRIVLFTALAQTNTDPSAGTGTYHLFIVGDADKVNETESVAMALEVETNTSAQIRWRINAAGAGTSINIQTTGWIDTRGRIA